MCTHHIWIFSPKMHILLQGNQKVSVHLTNNPHTIDELKMAITEYIRNVDRVTAVTSPHSINWLVFTVGTLCVLQYGANWQFKYNSACVIHQRFTLILIFKASFNGKANEQNLVTFHQKWWCFVNRPVTSNLSCAHRGNVSGSGYNHPVTPRSTDLIQKPTAN